MSEICDTDPTKNPHWAIMQTLCGLTYVQSTKTTWMQFKTNIIYYFRLLIIVYRQWWKCMADNLDILEQVEYIETEQVWDAIECQCHAIGQTWFYDAAHESIICGCKNGKHKEWNKILPSKLKALTQPIIKSKTNGRKRKQFNISINMEPASDGDNTNVSSIRFGKSDLGKRRIPSC